ncbi:MAG: PrsW family intramembrane metalloprotease [Propionibacteriaceae bacterium]
MAHFCHVCGSDLQSSDGGRKGSFAVKPDESVTSFALVSTIMPSGVAARPNTYRLALEITLALVALTAIVGAVPIAVMIAAFAVPVVYIVYLYDVNLWEDEPLTVTGAAFALTLVLAIAWTLAWLAMSGGSVVPSVVIGVGGPTILGFLVAGVLAPVVGEVIRQVGPLFLASRPKFDDLMDGLTFGVISGVAFATGDTLVKHWPLITGGFSSGADGGAWLALLVLEGFIKPLVLGTATGIACAEFSGLGQGYDGFTNRYFRGLGEAMLASVLYFGGTYLLAFVPNPTVGTVLSILYGLALLAVLVIRVRTVLHKGLLEAALEFQARNAGVGADGTLSHCSRCEMPLLPGAAFCTTCGTSVMIGAHLGGAHLVPAAVAAPSDVAPPDSPPDTSTDAGTTGEGDRS